MAVNLPNILPLAPYYREMVWGGRSLENLFGKKLPPKVSVGESFELSGFAERESTVAEGPLAGVRLTQLIAEYGSELLGNISLNEGKSGLPLLIKLLDACQDLSIQVHPDDQYAKNNKLNDRGKMEAWFVLHSSEGRVAYGLKDGVGPKEFESAVNDGFVEEVIRFFPVKRGDLVFSPPGTVHALCQGVVIYEVQQSSDLTFRIYDYERPGLDGKPRELHLDRAMDVIDFTADLPSPRHWSTLPDATEEGCTLVDCEHFRTNYFCDLSSRHEVGNCFEALTVVNGSARLNSSDGEYVLSAGNTAFLKAGAQISVESVEGKLEYIISAAVTGD
ncbi:MAG: type I phosphomannose isomerase catalytic subunit [Candidatus Latescibacterota bacterium]|nr:type I phosphomannose isomerase catalytic subunit [Candidatus Latescibacterota bacterium]